MISVEDYLYATSQIAQTTLRSVLGQQELDDLLSSRDKINAELTRIIDEHTNPWGIKVATVEVKNVDLPQDMQRAMSKQAEAERERRAKVINADGEFQAAAKLSEAADVLSRFPIAIQLRYLQTMREIASERNTTTFFPVPVDLLGSLRSVLGTAGDGQAAPRAERDPARCLSPAVHASRIRRLSRGVSSVGRARRSQRRGRGFDSLTLHQSALLRVAATDAGYAGEGRVDPSSIPPCF